MTLPCFRCGIALVSAFGAEDEGNYPSGATVFVSYGNYGSTVFDPAISGESYIEVNICDRCLKGYASRVLFYPPPPVLEVRGEPWSPPE